MARLGELIQRDPAQALFTADPPIPAPFSRAETAVFPWVYRLEREAVFDLVASRSYVILMPAVRRDTLLDEVRRFMDEEPALAGDGPVELPYVARCFRAQVADAPG